MTIERAGRFAPVAQCGGNIDVERSAFNSIPNSFEIYPGTHTSAVADRFQNHVIPFFSKTLCFSTECQ